MQVTIGADVLVILQAKKLFSRAGKLGKQDDWQCSTSIPSKQHLGSEGGVQVGSTGDGRNFP